MLQVNRLKRYYRKFLLIFVLVAILLLISKSTFMVPHYTYSESEDLAFRGLRDLIWSNESEPILSPRYACSFQPNTSMPEILVMVPSALSHHHKRRRDAIRNSWANTPLVREGKINVIFVLGQNQWRHGEVLSYQRCQRRQFCWVQ